MPATLLASTALVIAAACNCTAAQYNFYAGPFATQAVFSQTGGGDAKPRALGIRVGALLDESFAVEARLARGVSADELSGTVPPAQLQLDPFFGVYGKGMAVFSDSLSVYGLLGVARTGTTVKGPVFSVSDTDTDLSFGVGADFGLSRQTSLGLEWARLLNKGDARLDAVTLGLSIKF